MPEWLGNLSSLQYLSIRECENLGHLPSKEALAATSLQFADTLYQGLSSTIKGKQQAVQNLPHC